MAKIARFPQDKQARLWFFVIGTQAIRFDTLMALQVLEMLRQSRYSRFTRKGTPSRPVSS